MPPKDGSSSRGGKRGAKRVGGRGGDTGSAGPGAPAASSKRAAARVTTGAVTEADLAGDSGPSESEPDNDDGEPPSGAPDDDDGPTTPIGQPGVAAVAAGAGSAAVGQLVSDGQLLSVECSV